MALHSQSFTGAAGTRPLVAEPGHAPSPDGWLGTHDEPGYRAGPVVVKLADLPVVDARHLYLDLLRLDAQGLITDSHSGPCPALARDCSADERARFVRTVAELLRHAVDAERGFGALNGALAVLREQGIDGPRLAFVTQQLDACCSDAALAAALADMLVASLGEDEARHAAAEALARLPVPRAAASASLPELVAAIVQAVGRVRARRYLREATDFALLPTTELLGL